MHLHAAQLFLSLLQPLPPPSAPYGHRPLLEIPTLLAVPSSCSSLPSALPCAPRYHAASVPPAALRTRSTTLADELAFCPTKPPRTQHVQTARCRGPPADHASKGQKEGSGAPHIAPALLRTARRPRCPLAPQFVVRRLFATPLAGGRTPPPRQAGRWTPPLCGGRPPTLRLLAACDARRVRGAGARTPVARRRGGEYAHRGAEEAVTGMGGRRVAPTRSARYRRSSDCSRDVRRRGRGGAHSPAAKRSITPLPHPLAHLIVQSPLAVCHVQDGWTPLDIAAKYSVSVAVVKALLAAYPEAVKAKKKVRRPGPACRAHTTSPTPAVHLVAQPPLCLPCATYRGPSA